MADNKYTKSIEAQKRQYGTGVKDPRKLAKAMAYDDIRKSQRDERRFKQDPQQFGLTQAERQGMVGESMAAAGQAAAAQQAGMARQGMGQGGFQAGYMQQATRQLGAAPAQAAATASMEGRKLGEAKIAQKGLGIEAGKLSAAAGLEQARTAKLEAQENKRQNIKTGVDTATALKPSGIIA